MLLQPGETVLRSAYAVLEDGVVPEASLGPGVLYLTNHRIVFEQGRPHRLGRARPTSTVVNSSLLEVHDVAVPPRRLRAPRLRVELTHGKPSFELLDPAGWAHAIALAKRAFPVPGATVVERVTIERQVVKVRCRFCGSLAPEVDRKCPACGAPL
ncbi:MAG TPA: hypothetical protein VMG81_07765 [Thermoplasmata archaeon]|nr:hypothetical protein [Thermoplasmata archaeon]